jgi:hypothetical protein
MHRVHVVVSLTIDHGRRLAAKAGMLAFANKDGVLPGRERGHGERADISTPIT